MRIAVATLTSMLLALVSVQTADACGYGLFDPDVETAVTGDAIQAKQAMDRITTRGRGALPAVEQYLARAVRGHQSYVEYLSRLYQADPSLKMAEERRQTEIKRARTYLEWGVERIRKLDLIIFALRGNDLGGEPWQFHNQLVA